MTLPKKRGRNPVEQDKIAAFVRKKIISGRWPAGYKIPTHIELGKKFGVTTVTIHRTLSSLTADGFLRVNTSGNKGTYVNETPPHLFNYALVFPSAPSEHGWNLFYKILLDVSRMIQDELEIRITPYFRIDGNTTRPDYLRLTGDIRKERLAGMIFASPVFMIEKTPLVLEGRIPRIIIGDKNAKLGIPGISMNSQSFIERSLDYLEFRKCRRVAFISTRGQKGYFTEQLALSFAKRKFISPPQWWHLCHLEWTEAAVNIVRLLLSPETDTERPDAILVGDDNLIGSVCKGVEAADIKVPKELEIVSHCNFPLSTKPCLPVKFIGYDTHAIMSRCIEILKLQKSSSGAPRTSMIDVCTDDEFSKLRTL